MVRLALAALVVVLAGCKGELNPSYCGVHREDPDCLTSGVDLLDAPAGPQCTADPDCTGATPVCDTAVGHCVECLLSTSCPSMQVCGTDQRCHGCVTDGDCASGVCQATQSCAMEQNILYAIPNGSGTECSRTSPCAFSTAVGQLTATRFIIKLGNVPGTKYTDAPITVDEPYGVQIIGTGVTYAPAAGEAAITASGANLEILGLTIENASATAVRCTSGVLTLQGMTLDQSGGYGVQATDCSLRVSRTRLSNHPLGAIAAGAGMHEIVNNIVSDTGTGSNIENGAVTITAATGGRLAFNTIVNTSSRSGNRIGGISCTEATAGAFAVAQNVVAAWGSANNASGPGGNDQCTFRENFETQNLGSVGFTPDYHLTAATPAGSIRDANTPAMQADCSTQSVYLDDIDRQARPFNNFCDRGADEYRP